MFRSPRRVLIPGILIPLVAASLSLGVQGAVASAPKPTPSPSVTKIGAASVVSSNPHNPTPAAGARMFAYPEDHFTRAAAKLPDKLVSSLHRDLGISAETYLADADASARAVDVVGSLTAAGVHVLDSSISGTKLTVNVASRADVAAVTQAGATAVVGAAKPFKATGTVSVDSGDAYPGKPYFVSLSSTTIGECTIGFTGYEVSTGALQPITAGHCVVNNHVGDPAYGVPVGPAGAYTQAQLLAATPFATLTSGEFGGGYDSGIATMNAGKTEAPDVATWGGGAGPSDSSAPVTLTGETAAIKGAKLCKSGGRSGWSCGKVLATNQQISVLDDNGAKHLVNATIATTCLRPGDSGGAAIIGTLAAGINSFGTNTLSCTSSHYYAGFFPIVTASGHKSATTQNPGWELQVALPTPVITTAASVSSLRTTESLTGTLATGDSYDKVKLFLDGSSTPTLTTTASSGKWSFPMKSVPQGSHTFVVRADLGTWSHSATVSRAFTVFPGATITKPTISGTAKVGSTLTAKTKISPTTGTVTYQWQANKVNVGTNQSTYVPTALDYNKKITVTVTGSAPNFVTTSPSTSTSTKAVVHGTLTKHTPVISGHRNVDQTLTATSVAWGPAGVVLSYKWLRDGKTIAGATGSTYVLTAADHGKKIDVTFTGTLAGYTTVAVGSTKTKTATAYPLFTTSPMPTISNTAPKVGDVLTADHGSWAPGIPTFTYQWRVNGAAVSKQTKSSFTVPTTDVGKAVTVTVTAKESGRATTSETSAATTPVASIPFTTIGTPTFAAGATLAKGKTWKVVTGTWSPKPTFSYKWMRNGAAISKATKSSYTITSSDLGKSITVLVTAKKTGYTSVPWTVGAP